MQAFLKKNFWVVNAATVAICAVLAAKAVNHVIAARLLGDANVPSSVPVPVVTKPKAAEIRDKAGEPLAKRNMFCSTCEPPQPEQPADEPITDSDHPPITSLPLRLVATNVSEREARSFATISNTSTSTVGAYRIGDPIPGAGPVLRIAGRFVNFTNESSRRVERVSFDAEAPRPATPTPRARVASDGDQATDDLNAGIRKVDDTHYEIERSVVEKVIANPNAIRGARIVPSIKNGKPNGFKLYAIRPSSAFAMIGLQNGDTIHGINGFDLTTPDKALEVYIKVREANSLSVSLSRRGKPVQMDYQIR